MKIYLSLTLMALLLACGEARIKSVDDEILDQANADKAAADLKQAQTALIGTWRACVETSDAGSSRYEYAFASDGQASLLRLDFENSTCEESAIESDGLTAAYELLPVKEGKGFTLNFKWTDGKRLKSEYQLTAADAAQFPKVFELKDQSDLKLVELKDKDHFLALEKVPADEAEQMRKKAELITIEYATSLLRRNGTWQTPCVEGKRTSLQFKVEKSITMISTHGVYEEKDCKTLKENESESKTVNFTLASVPDLAQKKIVLDTGKAKGFLKVAFDKIDQLELSDLIGGKNMLTVYKYSAGVAP